VSRTRTANILPGFRLATGYALTYLCLLVLLPLAAVVAKASMGGLHGVWSAMTSDRALSAYRLSVLGALAAAAINTAFGLAVAWALVRYRFPGRKLMDALIDLPLALPTAVAGIALTAVYARDAWLGAALERLGITVAYTNLGILIAMVLVGLPFTVRTVQPVIEDMDAEIEEAAASLGASTGTTFRRIIFPTLLPALLTGFALAFAKAVGEYGSVIFISSNIPRSTEIAPLLIMTRLEEFDYAGAAGVAVGLLALSLALLFIVNSLQAWSRRTLPA
jgi:sulfate transport system permease protein